MLTRDKPKESVAEESENMSGGQHWEDEIRKAGTKENREYFVLLFLTRISKLNVKSVIMRAERKENRTKLIAFDVKISA